jgi:hypothetical protein
MAPLALVLLLLPTAKITESGLNLPAASAINLSRLLSASRRAEPAHR